MGCKTETSHAIRRAVTVTSITMLLVGCGATLPDQSQEGRHIDASSSVPSQAVPEIIDSEALADEQTSQEVPALYSVVAQDLPVRELLFTIARDAGINIDIHPDINGRVSINAVDQTLPQILDRVSRQANIRWSVDYNGNLLIEEDRPYWNTYRIDYVNVDRSSSSSADISNSIGGSGTSGSSSSTLSQTSENNFWQTLATNLDILVDQEELQEQGAVEESGSEENKNVVINAETGVIAVRATASKHEEVRSFINLVEARALQQVLIEATVVEVVLNDQYQAGVDWSAVDNNGRLNFIQSPTAGALGNSPTNILAYDGADTDAVISALSQFGNSQILSSPKIMALNNQAAMLRVVDNRVYFTIEVEPAVVTDGAATDATFETEINTVPVGFSMTVTPQVGDNNQVTLNVRPTISRIAGFVNDPNPILAQEGIVNQIPEIQIREIESVLKIFSGQTAILGGLMQDSLDTNTDGVPGVSRMPLVGNLFSYRDDRASKTELIIFIRPMVIKQPSLQADLQNFKQFLPTNGGSSLNSSQQTLDSGFWRQ